MPNVNSTIQYYGTFAGDNGGLFQVCVESVALNDGHLDMSPLLSTPTSTVKRKWAAFASPNEEVATASTQLTTSSSTQVAASASVQSSRASADVLVIANNDTSHSLPILDATCHQIMWFYIHVNYNNIDEQVAIDPCGDNSCTVDLPLAVSKVPSTAYEDASQSLAFQGTLLPDILSGLPATATATPSLAPASDAIIGQPTMPGLTMTPSIYSFLANYAKMATQPGSSPQLPITLGLVPLSTLEPSTSVADTVASDSQLVQSKSKDKHRAKHS
ncbi:hypothetical protein L210DRAFT_3640802 [Boletus edulis BED1]|uniref:Uncharacterized protein n=1 Tax=Boletus edulis BED1 TaxID=1328754 RepID=A0AAD4C504_BOLED|nr:hypothetical protein L210DRAFT_3640802 [Boletus edulis BED1]